MTDAVSVSRKLEFSSAHFYRQEKFSQEENIRVFGACYTTYGHGHNYVLEATIIGAIDPQTRLVMNLADLDRILFEVTRPLDHHHLNFDMVHFKTLVPTTENIALYLAGEIRDRLKGFDPKIKLSRIRLFEKDDLWVEVCA